MVSLPVAVPCFGFY